MLIGRVPVFVSPQRVIVPALALCLLRGLASPVGAQQRIELTNDLYPGALERPHETWIVSRVVDDLTGAPIADAEVFLVREREAPLAGEFWFTRKVTTDAAGFLRVPIHDIQGRWHMQVLRHRDYGVSTRSGFDEVWRVGRAFDLPVRITDWLGRPAPGAKIGFCGGCGHTPDLVNAVADANGVAVLRGVDPWNHIRDLYVQHPGLALGYDSVDWFPGDGPKELRCAYSEPITGRVLDHTGKPAAGVFVCGGGVHRGPWGKTAADGSFTVLGARGRGEVLKARTADGREVYFPEYPRHPVTLTLPDPEGDDPHEGLARSDRDEPLPATEVRTIVVRCVDAPAGARVHAEFPGRTRDRESGRVDQVVVPRSGPFVVVVAAGDSRRRFAFAGLDEQDLPLELRWTPAPRVRGRAVDGRGQPVAVRVRWRQRWRGEPSEDPTRSVSAAHGRFELAAPDDGRQLLEIVPERDDLLPWLDWLAVPLPGEGDVELGDVRLADVPQLQVVAADGRPRVGLRAGLVRAGCQRVDSPRWFPLRADGAWLGPVLRAGDVIVVEAGERAVPFRAPLVGAGPWHLRVPDARLSLDVVDEGGSSLQATVLIGDACLTVRDAGEIEGLPRGELRCFVSAPGRKTAIVDVTIRDEPARVRVELPRR